MNKLFYKIIIIILIITSISSALKSVGAKGDIIAPAKSMVVLEGNTGEVLYEFKKDLQVPMASVTKITTAILAIENSKLDEVVNVDDCAVGIEGTSIYLNYGEKITMENLLYGLMLASGNDCAIAIACHIGKEGGVERFVDMMNEFVNKLGLQNTHYDNPHGLDSLTHYTSAYDLAKITAYALKNETFRKIVSTKYKTIEENEYAKVRYLKNKNKLLFSRDDCIGVKTGFTDNAGRCLVNASEKNGLQIISVVLKCAPMFEECERLTNLAFNEFEIKNLIEPYTFVGNVKVINGDKEEIGVATINGFSKLIKRQDEGLYKVEYNIPNEIVAPIALDTQIGEVLVKIGDEIIYKENLYAIDSSKNIDIKYLIENIISQW